MVNSHNSLHSDEQNLPNPELLELAARTVETGLLETWRVHEQLGEEGIHAKQQNQFNETALEADVASERVMIDVLLALDMPVLIHSEEHGILEINAIKPGSRLLAVMDGLDGSSVYQKERGIGRYGSMFALFDNDNPRYDQYLATGIMLHTDKTLLLAVKGQGVKAINVETGETTKVHTNPAAQLDSDAITFAEKASVPEDDKLYDYFVLNTAMAEQLEAATGVSTRRTGSTAGNIGEVAKGMACLDLGATRKGNLEFATAYGLITEAGGLMGKLTRSTVSRQNSFNDLGAELFLEWGQSEHLPVLVGANAEIIEQAREAINF